MAKSASDGPSADHNIKEINKIIQDAVKRETTLRAKRDEINADIRHVRAAVKAEGIKMDAYRLAYKLHNMEDNDRDEHLDSMKIAFQAMNIGFQADMFGKTAAAE